VKKIFPQVNEKITKITFKPLSVERVLGILNFIDFVLIKTNAIRMQNFQYII
jgi:hypothetical protein